MLSLADFDLSTITSEKLGGILIDAKKAYYTSAKPIMDDHTYDVLEDHLRKIAPHHRLFSKVGTPNFDTGWNKKSHTIPMGSQNKVTNFDELVHYFELKKLPLNAEFVTQPKCDGLSVELVYQNGKHVESITRGDGLVGDVITQNIVKMQGFVVNPTLSLPARRGGSNGFTGSVRCEIVVTKSDFAKLPPEYSNPRNAASGISQRLDSKYSELCTLMAVDILSLETALMPSLQKTEESKTNSLKSMGFTTVESTLCQNFDQIEKIYQDFLNSKRLTYPYDIDGLVIKINDNKLSDSIGIKNNRPGFQVAYKFPANTNQSTIKNIDWQVGPMGLITPVANIDPVEVSGAIISYASLGNYDLVKKMELNIGDIIEISRRGDVIPHVDKIITKVTPGHIVIPAVCPSCHTQLTIEDKFLRCPNTQNCLPQIIGSLNLFCQSLNILGISTKTIEKLYESGLVKTPGDFYTLSPDDIANLDNLGDKSATNIIFQIQSKKSLTLVEVFDSAIIPNFSAKRITQVIDAGFDTPTKLLNLQVSNLLAIKGFKITLAQKIINGIALRKNWIESILSHVEIKNFKLKNKNLEGLSFCITGDLSQPRKDIEKLVIENGGKIATSVSKNTSYLLTNETSSKSSKFTTAKKLGISIIDENRFNELLGII